MYMFAAMIMWLIGSLKKSQYIHINYKMEMLKTQELHFTNTNTQSGNTMDTWYLQVSAKLSVLHRLFAITAVTSEI